MSGSIFNETLLNQETVKNQVNISISSIEEIDKKIKELENKLKDVKGRETEVYTRIVGYHRDVRNWNKGKKEEYKDRVTFDLDLQIIKDKINSINKKKLSYNNDNNVSKKSVIIGFYKVFHSHLCRNCPPVLDFLRNLNIPGEEIDVSTESGLNSAKKYNIMSTPSVVLFDREEEVIDIVTSFEKLKEFFNNI